MKFIRSIPPVLRLTFGVVLVGFVGLLTWQFQQDIIWATTVTAGVLLVGEFLTFHRSFLLSLIPVILHLLFSALFASSLFTTMSLFDTSPGFILWTIASVVTISLLVATIFPVIARNFAQGRVWLNLFISFIIYNVVLVTATVELPDLTFVGAAGLAAGAGFLWLLLRAFFPLQRKTELAHHEAVERIPTSAGTTSLYKTLDTLDGVKLEDIYNNVRFYHVRDTWYAIVAAQPKKKASLTSAGFFVDMEDRSDVLPALLSTVADWSRMKKVKASRIHPMLAIVGSDTFPPLIQATKVAAARTPDKNIGMVHVIASDKLVGLLRGEDKVAQENIED